MKQIFSDIKKGIVKIKIENLDDLWYLSNIVDNGDVIKAKTLRKLKIGEATERTQAVIRKPVFIAIKTEKVEFQHNIVRVSGKIIEAPEDVPLGSYHTINVEENSIIAIQKEQWLAFQLKRLKEACQVSKQKIIIVVHDREEAYIALLKKYGFDLLTHIKGTVQKKADLQKIKGSFYKEILDTLGEYDKRYTLSYIIVASPAFWKEELMKENTNDELKSKIILATCSSVDETGIHEVLKRPEVKEALKQDRFAKEINLVEELLKEISKNNLGVYGLKETKEAVTIGAVSTLLVTDSFIRKQRESNKYSEVDRLLKMAESTKADIHIISSEHDGGKKLDGLGGIGALLRFKMRYE